MFIKKDLRKIEEILHDKNDKREIMILSKRPAEFQGGVGILCRESNLSYLMDLKVLNLYDNSLSTVDGIHMLNKCPLRELNLGRNELLNVPFEVYVVVYYFRLFYVPILD